MNDHRPEDDEQPAPNISPKIILKTEASHIRDRSEMEGHFVV